MPDTDECVFCVEAGIIPEDGSVLEELLCALDLTCSTYINKETGVSRLRVFADNQEDADALKNRLQTAFESWRELLAQPVEDLEVRTIQREDWAESWKEHFYTFRASKRIVVKPSWDTYTPEQGDIVLEIDPGMCFGTGHHGTTQACLQFMDDLETELGPVSFLDAGCGSGILSLAAASLSLEPIVAFDHDPDAVTTSGENLERAGVRQQVTIQCADVADFSPDKPFRVVTANILAHILQENAERIVSWVQRPEGYLILAGILTEQYPVIRQTYEQFGVLEIRNTVIDEWTSGCFRVV